MDATYKSIRNDLTLAIFLKMTPTFICLKKSRTLEKVAILGRDRESGVEEMNQNDENLASWLSFPVDRFSITGQNTTFFKIQVFV